MTLFLKLGGSLITDKTGVETVHYDVLARLAEEIAEARAVQPDLKLLLGHGSGSFGHVAAAKYDTRTGVQTADQWRGFAEVSSSASRISKIVTDALLAAGVPALSFQPSASAVCENGRITQLTTTSIHYALAVDDGDDDLQPSTAGTVVDCPGYGYAKSSRADRNRWQDMVDRYLLDRDGLVMTLVLVDGAVGPTALDVEMLDWLRDSGIPFTVVATKHDKVKSSKRTRRRRDLAAGCGVDERAVVWTSADRNVNVGMLRGLVRAWLT